ncbi:MAG: hypothetical protein ABSF36_04385 [Candidatus Methanomethylicaceae archaeon]
MEIKTIEETLKEIFEGYNRRPKSWRIASDFRGNSLVIGPDDGYRLKTMMINPYENIGVGARIDDGEELGRSMGENAPCGFRPIDADMTQSVLSLMSNSQADAEKREMIRRVLAIDPVPTWSLGGDRTGAVVGGPFIAHPDLRMVSKKQSELDQKLELELNRLFCARYPMRASAYR